MPSPIYDQGDGAYIHQVSSEMIKKGLCDCTQEYLDSCFSDEIVKESNENQKIDYQTK